MFASDLTASSLTYEKSIVQDKGLKIVGESPVINCGVFECSYDFEVQPQYDLQLRVIPFLTNSAKDFQLFEVSTQITLVTNKECIEWSVPKQIRIDDKNQEKLFDSPICLKTIDKIVSSSKEVLLPIKLTALTEIKSLSDLKLNSVQQALNIPILMNTPKRFRLIFKPIDKTGELILYAEDNSDASLKASLDPWWNASWLYKRQLTLIDNISEGVTDKNTLVRVELPISTWANAPLANCNDLRIVYQDVTELDRNVFKGVDLNTSANCSTDDVNVFFNLYAALNGTDSTNYFVYYSNAGASSSSTFNSINGYAIPDATITKMNAVIIAESFNEGMVGRNSGTTVTAGVEGNARNFDTATDFIDYGSVTDWYNLFKESNHTIEFWVYFNSLVNSGNIFGINYVGDGEEVIFYNSATTSLRFRRGSADSACDMNVGGSIPLNQWLHIATTFSTTGGSKGFINGVQKCSNSITTSLSASQGWEARMGQGTNDAYPNSLMLIDGFRVLSGIKTVFPQGDTNSTARQISSSIGLEQPIGVSLDQNAYYLTPYPGTYAINSDLNINWFIKTSIDPTGTFNADVVFDSDTNYDNGVTEVIGNDLNLFSLSTCFGDHNFMNDENCFFSHTIDLTDVTGYIGIHLNQANNTSYSGIITIPVTGITIKIPLNELNPSTTITPFWVRIRGATTLDYNNQSSDLSVVVGQSTQPYTITIRDVNEQYTERKYVVLFQDINSYILQPYLIKTSDGATSLTVYTRTTYTVAVPGVYIDFYRTGISTAITSGITGSAGASFYLLPQQQYNVKAYYPTRSTLVYDENDFSFTTNPMYLNIKLDTEDANFYAIGYPTITYNPSSEMLTKNNKNIHIDINQSSNYGYTIINLKVLQLYGWFGDKNILWDLNFNQTTALSYDLNIELLDANGLDHNKSFEVVVTLFKDSNTILTMDGGKPYSFGEAADNLNWFVKMKTIRVDFGCSESSTGVCPGTTITAIVLTLLLIGAIVVKIGLVEPTAITIIGLILLGFFTAVNWINPLVFIGMFLFGVIALLGIRGITNTPGGY